MPGWLAKLVILAAGSVCVTQAWRRPSQSSRQIFSKRVIPTRISPSTKTPSSVVEIPSQNPGLDFRDKKSDPESPSTIIDFMSLGATEGAASGEREGHERGLRNGQRIGELRALQQAEQDARGIGKRRAFDRGYSRGQLLGEQKGLSVGERQGAATGKRAGYDKGWKQGYVRGKEGGYVEGYEWGYKRAEELAELGGSFQDGYHAGEAIGMDLADKEALRVDSPRGWETARNEALEVMELRLVEIDNASRWVDEAPAPELPRVEGSDAAAPRGNLLAGAQAEKNLYALGLASPSAINSAAVGRTREEATSPEVVFIPDNWPEQKVVPDFSVDRIPPPLYTYGEKKLFFALRDQQARYRRAFVENYDSHYREAYRRVYVRVAGEIFRNTYESQYALSLHESFSESDEIGFNDGYAFGFRLAYERQNQKSFEVALKEAQRTGEAEGYRAAYTQAFRRGEPVGRKMGELSFAARAFRDGYETGKRAGYARRLPGAQREAFESGYQDFVRSREEGAVPEFVGAHLRYTGGSLFAVDVVIRNLGSKETAAGALVAQVEGDGYDFLHRIVSLKSLPVESQSTYRNVFFGETLLHARGTFRVIVFANGQVLGEQTLLTVQPQG
ncbi:MAG: hypothetical protein KDD51_04415 [Bdellovibrionales bacterium]|nr:hypothetical protein [Bdellovibrionales bacterium]